MARKKPETLYDRYVRHDRNQMRFDMGLGMTPDELVDAFKLSCEIIEEMRNRLFLVRTAGDLQRTIHSDAQICDPE